MHRSTDRPFCIFLPLIEPHPPYTIPEDFYDMYLPSDVPAPIPPGLRRKPTFHEGIRRYDALGRLDEVTFRKIRAVYYGQVSYSDWLMGELLSELARTSRDKDTECFCSRITATTRAITVRLRSGQADSKTA